MEALTFDWKSGLNDLFGGSVNQQTLEEAAEQMASVSKLDDSYHEECLMMLNEGIRSANLGDSSIIESINKSGYQVSSTADAARLLTDFRKIYIDQLEAMKN